MHIFGECVCAYTFDFKQIKSKALVIIQIYIIFIIIYIIIYNVYLDCAACGEDLRHGQALYALDRQWHIYCFKCHECSVVLHGEYMGRYVYIFYSLT